MTRKKTIICDIDGTLIKHHGDLSKQILNPPILLSGTIEKLNEWEREGHRIILMTGRKESMRPETEIQLSSLGIFYDQLVMGATNGERVLINDSKPNGDITATAVCIERNFGISKVTL